MTAVASPLGRLFDVEECATYLGLTKGQLQRHIGSRRIRVLHAGRRVQIYAAWADEFRARFTIEPAASVRGIVEDNEPRTLTVPGQGIRALMPAKNQIRVVARGR